MGNDLSHSLIVKGCEFKFPIDYSKDMHLHLTTSTEGIESFGNHLAELLSKVREVEMAFVKEQRACHREYINRNKPDPLIYKVG